MNNFTVSIKYKNQDILVVPDEVCSQLRDREGVLAYTFPTAINPTTGVVTFTGASPEQTSRWKAGRYSFDVQYKLNNKTKTYFKGTLTVNEDISRCQ